MLDSSDTAELKHWLIAKWTVLGLFALKLMNLILETEKYICHLNVHIKPEDK